MAKYLFVLLSFVLNGSSDWSDPNPASVEQRQQIEGKCELCGAYLEEGLGEQCVEIQKNLVFHFWRSGEPPANFGVWQAVSSDLRFYGPPDSIFNGHQAEYERSRASAEEFRAFLQRRLSGWHVTRDAKYETLRFNPTTEQLLFAGNPAVFRKTEHESCYGEALSVGTFDTIPQQFAIGVVCTYSSTRRGKPVFIEDMGGNAVMMLNGAAVQLKFIEKRVMVDNQIVGRYVGRELEVLKRTQSSTTSHESASNKGYLVVTSRRGGRIKQRIYGVCGP